MDKLIEMLKRHEGVTIPYGVPVFCGLLRLLGVGRNIDSAKGGIGLYDDEVDYLLQNDIARVSSRN
jgi:hypothetical protein